MTSLLSMCWTNSPALQSIALIFVLLRKTETISRRLNSRFRVISVAWSCTAALRAPVFLLSFPSLTEPPELIFEWFCNIGVCWRSLTMLILFFFFLIFFFFFSSSPLCASVQGKKLFFYSYAHTCHGIKLTEGITTHSSSQSHSPL